MQYLSCSFSCLEILRSRFYHVTCFFFIATRKNISESCMGPFLPLKPSYFAVFFVTILFTFYFSRYYPFTKRRRIPVTSTYTVKRLRERAPGPLKIELAKQHVEEPFSLHTSQQQDLALVGMKGAQTSSSSCTRPQTTWKAATNYKVSSPSRDPSHHCGHCSQKFTNY